MNEKTLNGIEIGASVLLSAGINYVVDKTIIKMVDPQTISEKVITSVGVTGIDLACQYGIYKLIHSMTHPYEIKKYEVLVDENIKAIETNSEVAKVMAEHEIKVENQVEEIYNQIINPDFAAASKLLEDAKKAGVSSDDILDGSASIDWDEKGE